MPKRFWRPLRRPLKRENKRSTKVANGYQEWSPRMVTVYIYFGNLGDHCKNVRTQSYPSSSPPLKSGDILRIGSIPDLDARMGTMKDKIKIKLRAERNLPALETLLQIYGRKGATLREINRAVRFVGGCEAFADRCVRDRALKRLVKKGRVEIVRVVRPGRRRGRRTFRLVDCPEAKPRLTFDPSRGAGGQKLGGV